MTEYETPPEEETPEETPQVADDELEDDQPKYDGGEIPRTHSSDVDPVDPNEG